MRAITPQVLFGATSPPALVPSISHRSPASLDEPAPAGNYLNYHVRFIGMSGNNDVSV